LKHQKSPSFPRVQAAAAAAILQLVRQNASGREGCAQVRGRGLAGGGPFPRPGRHGWRPSPAATAAKPEPRSLRGLFRDQAAQIPRGEDGWLRRA